MTAEQALDVFWNGFTWKAYNENTVPNDAQLPYITYEATIDFFGNTVVQTTSLWQRSFSWAEITQKEKEIANAIGRGGLQIPCDGGTIWIKRATPWAQKVASGNPDIRRIALNLELEFIV